MELKQKLALGLWLLTVGVNVSAQTDVWRSDSLQEVVVTGTGTQHLLKDAPVQWYAAPAERRTRTNGGDQSSAVTAICR